MMLGVRQYSEQVIREMGLSDAAIAGMTGALDRVTPQAPDASTLYYKPEYTWSYEAGIHHNLADKMLQLDLAVFCMKTRDQQIARFAQSGMGRVMVNAGRSRSTGVEVGLRSQLAHDRLTLTANYGYTHAKFTRYDLGTSASGARVDYTGNRVPFVPQHTFSASADAELPVSPDNFVRTFAFGADVKGAGSIMWDEANAFGQKFYATLGAHVGATLAGNVQLNLWARNLTGTRYATFAFDSMGHRFAQYAAPRSFGLDVKWHF